MSKAGRWFWRNFWWVAPVCLGYLIAVNIFVAVAR